MIITINIGWGSDGNYSNNKNDDDDDDDNIWLAKSVLNVGNKPEATITFSRCCLIVFFKLIPEGCRP